MENEKWFACKDVDPIEILAQLMRAQESYISIRAFFAKRECTF